MSFGTKGCMYCEGVCNKECLPKQDFSKEWDETSEEVDSLVNELINKFTNWSGSYVYRDKLIEIYEQLKKK